MCLLTAWAQKNCLCQEVRHKWGTRGLKVRWCSLTVHIPWLLNLNLASVPQCMCSLGRAHMSSPPKVHSPCQPTTLMPSYLLVLWCGAVANPGLSQMIHIQRSQISKSDSPWLLCAHSEWGLDALLLLSHYFPIIEAVQPRFSRIPISIPQSWLLEMFPTYGQPLLLCAIHEFLGWNAKRVDMLCNSALGHRDRSRVCRTMTDCGQAVDTVWVPVMSLWPREDVGGLQPESFPSLSLPAEGAKLCET